MAKFKCQCGWSGKPMIMEPAQKVCPKCGSVRLEKLDKG
jgi:Zn finger protein HypA/HybF involved in hydrogenase expression